MAVKALIFAILFQLSFIKCDDDKGSLAFIIDDAASMADDIRQVKATFDSIYDAVSTSKYSPIENFILVTFNDSDAQRPTVTRDRDTFKRALNSILVEGDVGPKYSFSGIERALEACLPRSYVYVFTDASAKDSQKYEHVKQLAQKKSTKITFVLTGKHDYERDREYSPYYELAEATSGLVFHVEKSDVADILIYVRDTVKKQLVKIVWKKLLPGYGHPIEFTIDDYISDVQISLFGCCPKIGDVLNHKNEKQETKIKLNLRNFTIEEVVDPVPGVYTTKVGSECNTTVRILGVPTVNFRHGFSSNEPKSLKDTAILPKSGMKSYFAIKLHKPEKERVNLSNAKLLDSNGNDIIEIPLQLINDHEQFYVSNFIDLPRQMFHLMVVGHGINNNATILRLGPTPIEPIP